MVLIDTHPSFAIDPGITRHHHAPNQAILLNSPSNPSGVLIRRNLKALAELCASCGVLLIGDEIYHAFCCGPFAAAGSIPTFVIRMVRQDLRHDRLAWASRTGPGTHHLR